METPENRNCAKSKFQNNVVKNTACDIAASQHGFNALNSRRALLALEARQR